jgi:predicted DNA-binding protein (UPF0251 family)
MPRPRRIRRIEFQPDVTYFKPAGVPMANLKESLLSFEEFEVIRLIDSEEIDQNKAAEKMKISQPTLSRLLKEARKKLSDAIVNGQAIKIQGGNFKMVQQSRGRGLGLRRGRAGGKGRFVTSSNGKCICPKCGYKEAHQIGIPCYQKKCPKCGSQMTRR